MKRGERGQPVRSSHLGYDCYLTGRSDGGGPGQVRCVQRAIRLPPTVTEELRAILPTEFWWPQRDTHAAHACVDAILSMDRGALGHWKNAWPDHRFGFELYLDWLNRKAQAAQQGQPGMGGPGKALPIQLTKFPAQIGNVQPVSQALMELPSSKDITVRCYRVFMALVRFVDGQSALRMSLYGVIGDPHDHDPEELARGRPSRTDQLLSRAYIDIVTGAFDIIEHYPGRYQALGLPPGLICDSLGVERFRLGRRTGGGSRPKPLKGDPDAQPGSPERLGRLSHRTKVIEARQVMENVKEAQEAVFETFPAAPGGRPVSTPVPR